MSRDTSHGWVKPRADGFLARCGGPAICGTCQTEQMHERMLTGFFGAPLTAAQAVPPQPVPGVRWTTMESAPRDGTPLLLIARHVDAEACSRVVGWYTTEHGWIAQSYRGQPLALLVPSHWMHLPPFSQPAEAAVSLTVTNPHSHARPYGSIRPA